MIENVSYEKKVELHEYEDQECVRNVSIVYKIVIILAGPMFIHNYMLAS